MYIEKMMKYRQTETLLLIQQRRSIKGGMPIH